MAHGYSRSEEIIDRAKNFETIKEFRAAFPSDYSYAHKKGFANKAFSHMRRIRVTQDQYALGRHCTKCHEHKSIDNFLRVSSNSSRRRAVCLDCHNERCKEWRSRNSKKAREIVSESAKRNPHIAREMKKRARERSPESFAARDILKRTLRATGREKEQRTVEALGYSPQELRDHIESQFVAGMSWHNWGEWHIDHIKPVCVFISEGTYDPAKINALSNLRPLWAKDNISRSRNLWCVDSTD